MKHQSNYPSVVKEARDLAAKLEVETPAELRKQYGPPADRFNQVLGAVAGLLAEANKQLIQEKPSKSKGKK